MTRVLGISCFYHDSAACIVEDGSIVAAAQEERFTRVKHDERFPSNAVRYCLTEANVTDGRLDHVAFYDKPVLKFGRILETYLSVAPSGFPMFAQAVSVWLREKLWIEPRIREQLQECGIEPPERIYFPQHHESHAASAFFASPFREAAVLTVDGVGEWATATLCVGEGNQVRLVNQLSFPHSLGLLYSAFTYFLGFKVNSDEYKLMGLAPYGTGTYTDLIQKELIEIREDGSFRLNMDYFGYLDDKQMTNARFEELFGRPPRKPEHPITTEDMDVAKSIQEVTEEIMLRMARYARRATGKDNLCLAGGVALNCVANGRILREGPFQGIWIQPAAGDAGGAVGAALTVWHQELGNPREADGVHDGMRGAYLGPEFSKEQIRAYLDGNGYPYRELRDEDWALAVAQLIADSKVVGLLHGRMEFGPRALGNRSIVGDARSPEMQSVMNQKIKFRESFRPFAPACLEEKVSDWFEIDRSSPYMLLVAPVRSELCKQPEGDEREIDIQERVNRSRSTLPAITHVDYSARIQSVSRETNPRFHELLEAFDRLTGCGVIINTSFNVRDEPIVCTPEDAYRCFMRTKMDNLVLGPFLLEKKEQPAWSESDSWREVLSAD